MILKGGPLDHSQHTANLQNIDRGQAHADRLGKNFCRLRQIEAKMDALFGRILVARGENAPTEAAEHLDELVMAYPELRIPQVAAYPQAACDLIAHLDLEHGPLPGFEKAMERLCTLCLTPGALNRLQSQLYSVAARVSRERPELLPTAALAALSVRPPCPPQTLFTEMVLCASAIEWGVGRAPQRTATVSLDVSTWLIAEPSERLLAAIGMERAHYYASIPGVLPFLDPGRILFDVQRLVVSRSPHTEPWARTLAALASPRYTRRLRCEIKRVQGTLREQYPAPSIADVELLTHRALEALDDLPAQVNPLLQAIYIQSWVWHLGNLGLVEEAEQIVPI
jgi:hypothetical protein